MNAVEKLVAYAIEKELVFSEDRVWAENRLLEVLGLSDPALVPAATGAETLEETLKLLVDFAASRGLLDGESIVQRDLFDTKLMGMLTPPPSVVLRTFREKYAESPEAATDFYYRFSGDTDYIRRYRVCKDLKWTAETDYGTLDITVNLSKPEKDPKAIAAARNAAKTGYPLCQLCRESEGYAGRLDFPARQNHRILPVTVCGEDWFLQYSPYSYYNEHCILLNSRHVAMKIDRSVFVKFFDFLDAFPHYFIGSNADLPIVGGSILSHEHFQGGRYEFAMTRAKTERELIFDGFPTVRAGILHWPLTVLRLSSADRAALTDLADLILCAWRGYTDAEAGIFAETDGVPHNTITPIARMRDGRYELDLVLRNNRTSEAHPLGIFHPHAELHHIKKENIGLIEVMGLAVLPSRLKKELAVLAQAILDGKDPAADPVTASHAAWVEQFRPNYPEMNVGNIDEILRREVGRVFCRCLEDCGVYPCTEDGRKNLMKFVEKVGGHER